MHDITWKCVVLGHKFERLEGIWECARCGKEVKPCDNCGRQHDPNAFTICTVERRP